MSDMVYSANLLTGMVVKLPLGLRELMVADM